MVEEMLAARGITVSYETVRQRARKYGREIATRLRRRAPRHGDKWHLDEVVLTIGGRKHYLWRAVDQDGFVLDVLVQSRRDTKAAKRLLRKLLKKQGRAPRVLVTDKLKSYAAKRELANAQARNHGLTRFVVRGLNAVKPVALWHALTQNMHVHMAAGRRLSQPRRTDAYSHPNRRPFCQTPYPLLALLQFHRTPVIGRFDDDGRGCTAVTTRVAQRGPTHFQPLSLPPARPARTARTSAR